MKLNLTKKLVIGALGCASAMALWAFNPQPDPPGFGMISLVDNEALRINVVCHNPPDDRPSGVSNSCTANIGFLSSDGRTLKMTQKMIPAQASDFVEITRAELRSMGVVGTRIGLVPMVVPSTGSRVIPTAEVFDQYTLQTHVHMNAAAPRLSFFSNGL